MDLNSTAVVMSALFVSAFEGNVANCEEIDDNYRNREVQKRIEISESVLPMLVNIDSIDSSYLTFDADNIPYYNGSSDPLKVFTESARRMDIKLWIDNVKNHGFYIDGSLEVEEKRRTIRYMLADLIADGQRLPIPSHTVRPWTPDKQLWDVDKIYMINLKRRPERRAKMEKIFNILGVNATYWEATDGQNLPLDYHYRVLPGYLDPFHKRPIKAGEIGCFLSHYRIWQDVANLGLRRVIVFEDDLRFTKDGLERIREVLEDLDASKLDWDLIYLGRKKQTDQEEVWVPHHRHLSTVGYSYWTLGYILSAEGARRLLNAEPLRNLLPVDEYFPIMFNKHPNKACTF
ncbi:LPS glycosyltransferase [Dictyocaulus viviparus]|uniref:LPS glycosyltransferase n=1 Tax=Dictyocaulus viviparus TaxID=29172 RepID=A0A0D8X8Y6_DICVI|nr:LPS glycosyltransferase [Dictyocaulus viviparus]